MPEPKYSPYAEYNDQSQKIRNTTRSNAKRIWIDEKISTVASSGTTYDADSSSLLMPYPHVSRLHDLLNTDSESEKTQPGATTLFEEGYLRITPRLQLGHDYLAWGQVDPGYK